MSRNGKPPSTHKHLEQVSTGARTTWGRHRWGPGPGRDAGGRVRKTKQDGGWGNSDRASNGPRPQKVVAGRRRGPRATGGGRGRDRARNQATKRPPPGEPPGRRATAVLDADGGGTGGEFDPGSGSTLAACLMHASRTGVPSGASRGGRVRNTWPICPPAGGSPRKRGVIPHDRAVRVGMARKDRKIAGGGGCGRLAGWWGHGLPRR